VRTAIFYRGEPRLPSWPPSSLRIAERGGLALAVFSAEGLCIAEMLAVGREGRRRLMS
jgi:hypothetical protein